MGKATPNTGAWKTACSQTRAPPRPIERNSFIIWRGGEVEDFELQLQYRISEKVNSGDRDEQLGKRRPIFRNIRTV